MPRGLRLLQFRENSRVLPIERLRDGPLFRKLSYPKVLKYIGHNAFNGCSSLQSVDIPKSVKEIGDWAFEECCSLRSVVIPEGVKKYPGLRSRGASTFDR